MDGLDLIGDVIGDDCDHDVVIAQFKVVLCMIERQTNKHDA
jgi:hypothetical protein